MKKLPNDLGGFFYDDLDSNGLIYWFEALKVKIEEETRFKRLILQGLGLKLKNAS